LGVWGFDRGAYQLSAELNGVPKAYWSAFDPLTGRFVQVLEDLAVGPCEFPDTLNPLAADKASLIVELLARLHGAFRGFRVYFSERLRVLHYDRQAPAADQQLAVAGQVARMLAKLAATSSGSLAERDQIREGIGSSR
jgi:hypothetical protein